MFLSWILEFPLSRKGSSAVLGFPMMATRRSRAYRRKEAVGEDAARQFLPYVQMYEFEGLLFSDVEKLASGLGVTEVRDSFAAIRDGFSTPEEINDSPETAPSKRLLALMDRYEKPLYGSLAALEIGLDKIRNECGRFDGWVSRLEKLAN